MMIYKFRIENDYLSEKEYFDGLSGNKNVYICEFEIDCEEALATWFAVFKKGSGAFIVPISDGRCVIPYNILENSGAAMLGCYADCGDNKRISTNWLPINIEEGAYCEGTAPEPPKEELWETLLRNSVPVINENGNWFTYDMTDKTYKDTGFCAKGEQGPKGDKGDTGESPVFSAMFQEPKNFGKKVNGVVGDNIKVYRSIDDETLVFAGSGEMYDGTAYNDAYLFECVCGAGNKTVKKIYIKDGITSIGARVFNRFMRASTSNNAFVGADVKNTSFGAVGITVSPVILPKSVVNLGAEAFGYSYITDRIVINCDTELALSTRTFIETPFETIEIPNATAITGYDGSTFQYMSRLKNFTIGNSACQLETSISFPNSNLLTAASLANIANHLKAGANQTLTLHNTAKTLCQNTNGTVADGVFTISSGGDTALSDFITNVKGWAVQ